MWDVLGACLLFFTVLVVYIMPMRAIDKLARQKGRSLLWLLLVPFGMGWVAYWIIRRAEDPGRIGRTIFKIVGSIILLVGIAGALFDILVEEPAQRAAVEAAKQESLRAKASLRQLETRCRDIIRQAMGIATFGTEMRDSFAGPVMVYRGDADMSSRDIYVLYTSNMTPLEAFSSVRSVAILRMGDLVDDGQYRTKDARGFPYYAKAAMMDVSVVSWPDKRVRAVSNFRGASNERIGVPFTEDFAARRQIEAGIEGAARSRAEYRAVEWLMKETGCNLYAEWDGSRAPDKYTLEDTEDGIVHHIGDPSPEVIRIPDRR